MNENSWLYWSLPVERFNQRPCNAFPWMKIHGSIEAMSRTGMVAHSMPSFPWMKIHGSIEAEVFFACVGVLFSRFHEWKFMALLKHVNGLTNFEYWISFHEWKFMALLKQDKGKRKGEKSISGFHEWKFMALLKPGALFSGGFIVALVSMNENSWLYWSDVTGPGLTTCSGGFHEWKFMALLKHSNSVPEGQVLCRFHEWIFMALLKHVYTIIFGNVLVDLFNI